MKKIKLLTCAFVISFIIMPIVISAQSTPVPPENPGDVEEVDPTLQPKWAKEKTKYIKSFKSLGNQIEKLNKQITKNSKKITTTDFDNLNTKLISLKNKNTGYLEAIERDQSIINNETDLTNKINTQKTRVREIKNDITITYTELKLLLTINTYEKLGKKIQTIVTKNKFGFACEGTDIDSQIYGPMIQSITTEDQIIRAENERARTELTQNNYVNSKASIKKSKASIARSAKNIKNLVKLCIY